MKKLFTLLLCLGLVGCASNHYLLRTDPYQLTNDELLSYFYKVDKEINILENNAKQPSVAPRSGTEVRTVNLLLLTQGSSRDLNALRQRRTAVRMELMKRGMSFSDFKK